MARSIEETDDYVDGVMYATDAADRDGDIQRQDDAFGNIYRARFAAGWNAVVEERASRTA